MGFFSFKTQDTNKSIANRHSSKPTSIIYMYDNKGVRWREDDYEGYGVFGGKDYYELLAEMNGMTTREEGTFLVYKSGRTDILYPNLTHSPEWKWKNEKPKDCSRQGYFY